MQQIPKASEKEVLTNTANLSTNILTDPENREANDETALGLEKTIDAGNSASNNNKNAKSDVTFEADTITVEQQNNIMSASGNVRVMQKGDLLEAGLITYNKKTGIAKASGGVRVKTRDGIVHLAEEMVLDENFTHAVATPLVTTLSDGSRFSSERGDYRKQNRTVFDRSVFSPCNCD